MVAFHSYDITNKTQNIRLATIQFTQNIFSLNIEATDLIIKIQPTTDS